MKEEELDCKLLGPISIKIFEGVVRIGEKKE